MQKEYKASEKLLGIKFKMLDCPNDYDGRPILERDSNMVRQMDEVVQKKSYDLVITHSPGDHHQDHENTYHIVNSSLRRYQSSFWYWILKWRPHVPLSRQTSRHFGFV